MNSGPGRVEEREATPLVGRALPGWAPCPLPARVATRGAYCRLEPLDAERHGDDLWRASLEDVSGVGWTYLPYGPFTEAAEYSAWLARQAESDDPRFYAIRIEDGSAEPSAVGVASYLRMQPEVGSIEVGHIWYSPALQRTRAATEAMYLMMRHVFDELGYRRYEWKCDALNAPSRRAAQRLGFTYEGTFRQATIYKGRNRDTAWYSIVDGEWPRVRDAFVAWLARENFDDVGRQRAALEARARNLRRP